MRKLMNKIDRFCYTHPRFGIPNLMLIIVIGNAAVWLLAQMDTTGQIVPGAGLAADHLCVRADGVAAHLAAADAVLLLLDRLVP